MAQQQQLLARHLAQPGAQLPLNRLTPQHAQQVMSSYQLQQGVSPLQTGAAPQNAEEVASTHPGEAAAPAEQDAAAAAPLSQAAAPAPAPEDIAMSDVIHATQAIEQEGATAPITGASAALEPASAQDAGAPPAAEAGEPVQPPAASANAADAAAPQPPSLVASLMEDSDLDDLFPDDNGVPEPPASTDADPIAQALAEETQQPVAPADPAPEAPATEVAVAPAVPTAPAASPFDTQDAGSPLSLRPGSADDSDTVRVGSLSGWMAQGSPMKIPSPKGTPVGPTIAEEPTSNGGVEEGEGPGPAQE